MDRLLISIINQMEQLLERMQDEQYGVPVKTVKSFMSKIPSVFTGMLPFVRCHPY